MGDPKARRHVCTLPVGGGQVSEIEFEALVKSVDIFCSGIRGSYEVLIAGSKVDDPHLAYDHAFHTVRRT